MKKYSGQHIHNWVKVLNQSDVGSIGVRMQCTTCNDIKTRIKDDILKRRGLRYEDKN